MKYTLMFFAALGSLGLATITVIGGADATSLSVSSGDEQPASPILATIRPEVLAVYARAASSCSGLSWTILAAIGTVESANGTAQMPGVSSGHNPSGAEGPMQFEPATFADFSHPTPPGGVSPPTPYDLVDASFAAARMLCHDGAAQPGTLGRALFDYNHSWSYVARVLTIAQAYGLDLILPGSAADAGSGSAEVAVSYALRQIGTPYRWGGETSGVGFDCSGLVQAAWAAAGVAIPRVAANQMAAGPRVRPEEPLSRGDLVFFGPAGGAATHVGMVVDPSGLMVDAPHTGAFVRVEPFPTLPGSRWGDDIYLGATRPEGSG